MTKCAECSTEIKSRMYLDEEASVCFKCWDSYPEVLKSFTSRLLGDIARLEVALLSQPRKTAPIRGIDFDCEECGERKGYFLDNGWYRCDNCGYPSQ